MRNARIEWNEVCMNGVSQNGVGGSEVECEAGPREVREELAYGLG